MNGAERLVHTLLAGDVDVCFTNPGTSEMHFVAALDKVPGMRCVLGLFEGVVTGAADGYYRIADKPASTLLHLGPGLANGLANLHNAKKAGSGVVNIVGDHAVKHLALDAPLTSDIAGVARPMSHWVHSSASAADIAKDGGEAIRQAKTAPGRIATLILPADTAWTEVSADAPVPDRAAMAAPARPAASSSAIADAARALRSGEPTLLLLGGVALRANALETAGRIAAATGCALMAEFPAARQERGAGRVAAPRMPYVVDVAMNALAKFKRIVLVGTTRPVAFFAYPGKPGLLAAPDTQLTTLADVGDDLVGALQALADELGAAKLAPKGVAQRNTNLALPEGKVDAEGVAQVLSVLIPENAIIVDESVTMGRGFATSTLGAAPHDWLTSTGGSIGFALPSATGAAIAAPDRKVIALEGDGSGMYTLQSLWTMARENLDVTVVIFANRSYQILRGELAGVGAGTPGPRANDMLTLDRPTIDWVSMARGMGLDAARATTLGEFGQAFARALAVKGPALVELVV